MANPICHFPENDFLSVGRWFPGAFNSYHSDLGVYFCDSEFFSPARSGT